MSRYEKFPRSYADAAAILGDEAEVTISPGQACYGVGGSWLRKTQDGISTCNRYGAIVTFHPDNRIKIITQGRNDSWHVEHINSCLPKRYRVRKRGCHVALVDRVTKRTLVKFLASTIFTPAPDNGAVMLVAGKAKQIPLHQELPSCQTVPTGTQRANAHT